MGEGREKRGREAGGLWGRRSYGWWSGPLVIPKYHARLMSKQRDRSETARRLTPPVPMGAHKTRALGGPEPPLASSTLVQPIINKACPDPNALSRYFCFIAEFETCAAPIFPCPLPPFSHCLVARAARFCNRVSSSREACRIIGGLDHSHGAYLICD